MQTRKEFAGLGQAYAFFQRHSSEARASRQAWLPLLQGRQPERMLDFGCGPGDYLADLLEQSGLRPGRLTLIEPDPEFLQQARQRLRQKGLSLGRAASHDLIVSHHVLYYVPDLEQTLKKLWLSLEPNGRMILAQGGQQNGLNQILQAGFARRQMRCPYHFSEDTAATLERLQIPHRVFEVEDACQFPDSETGRRHILRFLLGKESGPLDLLDPFQKHGQICIPSRNQHFVIDRNASL